MLTDSSMKQTIQKLERLCDTLYQQIFRPVGTARVLSLYETRTPLHAPPEAALFTPPGQRWGGEGVYGWFHLTYTVPDELAEQALYLMPEMRYYEATLWVNGRIHSNYAAKFVEASHGNHWCNRFTERAQKGETYDFMLECYAWHDVPGNHPLSEERLPDYTWETGNATVMVRDEQFTDFLFDLRTLLSLRAALPETDFRRAEVENALYHAHLVLCYDPAHDRAFRDGLTAAAPLLREQLEKKNGSTAPFIGLIGHSHMDTAWLWPMTETEKKCARTYAGVLNLMEEYPEYRFIQSSAFHSDWIRRHYPELFERIRQRVAEGRYEPNGGVWVECDCNLTGGETMIRQFLWGQRFTRQYFGYTSDCFWLPDTFGYSSAIPQIMKGCGVRYFLTTKMSWNDTNSFPLTTFLWQGIDGTRVLTHLNRTHQGPSPEMYEKETTGNEGIREKRVANRRLFSFGKGDGGGGPEFEMLEMARRLGDLQGVARSAYTTVSDFMHDLEADLECPSVWADELYLELHRGTLTNQHEIKHNNRFCEIALHNLELAIVLRAVTNGTVADITPVQPLMNQLLVHQFHDLLPGTCIHSAHEEARAAISDTITRAETLLRETFRDPVGQLVLFNSIAFTRSDTLHLPGPCSFAEGIHQSYTDINGQVCTAVAGITLAPLSSMALSPIQTPPGPEAEAPVPFTFEGDVLTTPFARIRFSPEGAISSMIDLRTGRELVGNMPFNTFLLAEDVPAQWDNWDIDADTEEKFHPAGTLLSRETVSVGPVECRIRSVWQLTERTRITQDMIFDARSPLITFDTCMDWQEDHRFLKAAFDTTLLADGVRNEIQFGSLRRSNHRSTTFEKARFEVCNHKYSDLSENNYGIALLNDSKYGISVLEGSMHLSLHKGGCRPDREGDKGRHFCRYAIYPHVGGFSSETVIRPAYTFNYPVISMTGSLPARLCQADDENVVIETVKPCEDVQNAYILRLYESAGGYARTRLTFFHPVLSIHECNMLEEEEELLDPAEPLPFTPFRIRTLKVRYPLRNR
ncbi:MAG: alpha-mannosidase [Clostridia bacterium]|nr:alpha-mannosidase [Clostridia bacterium]